MEYIKRMGRLDYMRFSQKCNTFSEKNFIGGAISAKDDKCLVFSPAIWYDMAVNPHLSMGKTPWRGARWRIERRRAVEENREQMLHEILASVARQIRLPLNNIGLALQWLLPEDAGEREQRSAAILQQSYYRMMRLADQLSAAGLLAGEAVPRKANVAVDRWLEERCAEAEGLFREKGVALSWRCDLTGHIVGLDREHMDRLLWNLLSNALKFTPAGGAVTVTVRRAGAQLLLTVSDTGCGIPEDRMDTVFDRWHHGFDLDPAQHGVGLGLPLCRAIAETHGGRLMLDSREGEGTTVTVALPDRRAESGELRQTIGDYAGGHSRVLLALSDALPYTAFTAEKLD